ncbi:GntR family transcriptional regulator [Oceanobacter antarcticus]|uniref:Winged helix-turn-helix domain-containing protein n=1 Tax=Oceanobacter antarcticus TaxID=3133425 RepID=A0ABW8NNR9_9GAMM
MGAPRFQLHRYEQLTREIQAGRYSPGERIPGTRVLAETHGVSINTVLQAQKLLENQRMIEAVPRSGFFVKWRGEDAAQLVKSPAKA